MYDMYVILYTSKWLDTFAIYVIIPVPAGAECRWAAGVGVGRAWGGGGRPPPPPERDSPPPPTDWRC